MYLPFNQDLLMWIYECGSDGTAATIATGGPLPAEAKAAMTQGKWDLIWYLYARELVDDHS
jgi:hypothetical protein